MASTIKIDGVTISTGNTKIGAGVYNVSLPPCLTCPVGVPCAKLCYAGRLLRFRCEVDASWRRNYAAYQRSPERYFKAIRETLQAKVPKCFRWHVGGDIPSDEYLARMVDTADSCPKTRFLCFTKSSFRIPPRPANLTIVYSNWPGWKQRKAKLPNAWMLDAAEPDPRIPNKTFVCPGNCGECGYRCWFLEPGDHVVFERH